MTPCINYVQNNSIIETIESLKSNPHSKDDWMDSEIVFIATNEKYTLGQLNQIINN